MGKRDLWLLSLVLCSSAATAQPFPMNKEGEMRWVCAGIGEDERAALSRIESDANLKLVFAAGKRGAYLAGVDVVLIEREGKHPALKFTARGPICLVQAPAGRYQVEALFRDERRSAATSVATGVKQPGTLVFRFPEED